MARIEMTQDALLDALQEALADPEDPEGAMTMREICQRVDLSKRDAREMVRDMIDAGEAEPVRVRRPSLDGRIMPVPAYRLTEKDP